MTAIRRATITTLPQASQSWHLLLQALPDPAWVFDARTRRVLMANDGACALLEIDRGNLIGAQVDGLIATPEDHAYWASFDPDAPDNLCSDVTVNAASGRSTLVSRSVRVLASAAGQVHGLVSLRDCGNERRIERERQTVVAELQATLEATADGILVLGLGGNVRACNRRLADIWGMPEALFQARDDDALAQWMRRSVVDEQVYVQRMTELREATLLHSTDRFVLHTGQVIECVTRPLWSQGRPQGRVFSFRDLSESLATHERLAIVAATDALTGLPNRRLFSERLATAATQARRTGRGFALLVIDLDHFRLVNDTLGHAMGDRVLIDVAKRIQGCMRADDQLARVGNDQFIMLVDGADVASAEGAARRVLSLVAQPCELDGMHFTLTCSIGVALCSGEASAVGQLISNAEAAMLQAKEGGRACWRVHETRKGVDLRRQMMLDHAMRQALVSNRFRLHYQPQIDLVSGKLVGAEALIRWRDPEMGEITPGQFIPVAEDTGFIIAIGDWVLTQAVRQATLWFERGTPVPIAVNVSALQFQQAQFVDRVASVLAISGLPPALLELELTESILVRDAEEALHRLQALSKLGVRLSIDDFGTGYSSLAYLKRFPINKLKVDRSFVMGLPDDDSDAAIVRAILQMARALNIGVIAEGVETETQRQFLLAEGCGSFQGFLFAPALDSLTFEKRLLSLPRVETSGQHPQHKQHDQTVVRLVRG